MQKISISNFHAVAIFATATIYFYLISITLFPFLKGNFQFHASLHWFIFGYFLFIPLLIYPLVKVRKEGCRSFVEVLESLGIKRLTRKEWNYVFAGTTLIFLFTGLIFGGSALLHQQFGVRLLQTTPVFMEEMHPYEGWQKLYLLIWLPMFFFNIVGEEAIWRGYIQNRMSGRYSWVICAFLWAAFHLPFGLDMIIMASPALIIVPYIFGKTRNTTVGIAIHGIYNGPIFVLISLGIMQ
jgi:membrane protease YdiL (CAAX protease family)